MKQSMSPTSFDQPTVLLLAIEAPYNDSDMQSYIEEFINLARSNELHYHHVLKIKLREIDGAYFLTKGKLSEVRQFCEDHNVDHVIVSEPLTPQQERNLQRALNAKVFDRTRLILEIFEKSAQSAEGKAQVAMAFLRHRKTRLAGRGIHLSQQGGRIGTRGPGETAKEKETQHIENAILKLRRYLQRIEKTRQVQRKQRLTTKVPLVCLIGYTNAGKSTILNTLTRSHVLAQDKLFATLDTTTRELYLGEGKRILLSDTVGFIQQLPHHLIEAFKSTLSELAFADLLLHVIDISDRNWEQHIAVVESILSDLAINQPILHVFNKMDRLTDPAQVGSMVQRYVPHVIVDGRSREGIQPLVDFLIRWIKEGHNPPPSP